MNKMFRLPLLLILALVPFLVLAQVQTTEVEVRVTDDQGRPVPGARVAQNWELREGKLQPMSQPEFVLAADQGGIAKGKAQYFRFPIALMAVDASGERAGFTVLRSEAELKAPVNVRIQPMRSMRIVTTVREWREETAPEVSGVLRLVKEPVGLIWMNLQPDMTVMMPVGDFEFSTMSFQAAMAPPVPLSVTAGRHPIPPLEIQLDVAPLVKAIGQAPPELTFTEAVGLPTNFKLSDFKGKWVLFEIWGYW
jgi:hypothetical protein